MDRSQRSSATEIKALVTRVALERGASAVRIAPASADASSRASMRAAFERGDFATWPFDEQYATTASDPSHLLPHARSVVCIAMPYATPPQASRPLRGRVSNYAWSDDYHVGMRAMLSEIAALIDAAAGGAVTAIACDTKPIAERAFAARAGLGWIGKHTNLIVPKIGSFIFLGEIVTTLELPVDEPLRKTCGECTRCIDICPTAALRGDYTIDATRCIADLTQRTDAIPREMRPLLGDWIWGCDLCQIVCPPTQRAGNTSSVRFAPIDEEVAAPSLLELLRLRSGEFKRRYKRSAMGWRGAAVLRRNAAVALGNALDRATVPALAEALTADPHPMVRAHVAWALGRIGSPDALAALRSRYANEPEASVIEEIAAALKRFGTFEALDES